MNGDGASALAEHLPPQNLEAERQTLGAWLLEPSTIDLCISLVSPGDFYRDAHQRLATAILDAREQGRCIDAVSIAEDLTRKGEYRALGGDNLLREILDATPHAANAAYHAQIVRERAIQREVIQTCTGVITEGYSGLRTAAELVEVAESRIFAIAEREATGGNVEAEGLMVDAMLAMARREDHGVRGVATGFPALEEVLGGLKPQDLVILAARPSQGKTALALSILSHACLVREHSALFVSLEMSALSIADRLLSAHTGIASTKLLRAWELTPGERERITMAGVGLQSMQLTIADRPNQTVGQVAANARRIKSRRGLDLVVIDYMGLIDGQRQKGENRQEEVARISRRLKGMARELDVPVLCLHQLNRQSEQREGHRPRLSDLRESGQVEQDADAVLLLHRPEYYDANDQPGVAEVIVAKNRNGPTGTVRLMFQRHCTRFAEMPGAAY